MGIINQITPAMVASSGNIVNLVALLKPLVTPIATPTPVPTAAGGPPIVWIIVGVVGGVILIVVIVLVIYFTHKIPAKQSLSKAPTPVATPRQQSTYTQEQQEAIARLFQGVKLYKSTKLHIP